MKPNPYSSPQSPGALHPQGLAFAARAAPAVGRNSSPMAMAIGLSA